MIRPVLGFAAWLVFLVVLTECGFTGPVAFKSNCGLIVAADHSAPSPGAVDAVERAGEAKGLWTCKQLRDTTVRTSDLFAWTNSAGQGVAGETYCENIGQERHILIADCLEHRASLGSLAHELVHAATECPWSNVDHEGWDAGDPNIYQRIGQANADVFHEGF